EEIDRIAWASSSGVHASQLAEWSLLGILALTKGLPGLFEDKAAHRWREHWPVGEVLGKTLLVVGLGEIGREVARLGEAFRMRVVGVSRREGNLDGLLPDADAVVIALPLTEETRGLFDRSRLGLMRRGAILVNVGRGAVIDEDALVEALQSGRVGGAALDAFSREP